MPPLPLVRARSARAIIHGHGITFRQHGMIFFGQTAMPADFGVLTVAPAPFAKVARDLRARAFTLSLLTRIRKYGSL